MFWQAFLELIFTEVFLATCQEAKPNFASSFVGIFIVITSVFFKKEEWLNLFKISVLISGLSSVAAILQQ